MDNATGALARSSESLHNPAPGDGLAGKEGSQALRAWYGEGLPGLRKAVKGASTRTSGTGAMTSMHRHRTGQQGTGQQAQMAGGRLPFGEGHGGRRAAALSVGEGGTLSPHPARYDVATVETTPEGQPRPVFGTRNRNIHKAKAPFPNTAAAVQPSSAAPAPTLPPTPLPEQRAVPDPVADAPRPSVDKASPIVFGERWTARSEGHRAADLTLADQLFELSYVVAVKERAWRRVAALALLVGVVAGWALAHVFSPSLELSTAVVPTAASSAGPVAAKGPREQRGALSAGGCTVLQLDRQARRTISSPCPPSHP